MRDEHRERRGGREGGRERGGRGHHDEHRGSHGAQTFRRGRVLGFLEQLRVKRATLSRQLGEPEFDSIKQVIGGELKAIDQVIEDFIYLFDLQDAAELEKSGE